MHLTHYAAPANDQPGGGAANFCPNCGQPVSATDTFCPNCGANLQVATGDTNQFQAPQQPQATTPTQQRTAPTRPARKPRQPWSKKKKRLWWGIGVAAVAVIGFFVWGSNHYSRAATLDRTINDIKSGKHLTDDFTSASSDLTLSKSKLLPINRYYSDHSRDLSKLKADLDNSGRSADGDFVYEQNGHHLLFFPKYQISVSPVYPTVTTNHTGNVITLDNHKIATATSDSFTKKLSAMVPGEYHLQSKGKIGGHNLTNSSDYHITSNKTYDLELTTISVELDTVAGSNVYLNGKKIGTADSTGTYQIKNEPWTSDMSVYAAYTSSAGKATTPTTKLKKDDDGSYVDLDYKDMIDQSDADDFISSLFEAAQNLSDHDDSTDDDGDDMSDFFVNGTSNNYYADLRKMAKGYNDNDDLDAINMDTDVTDVKPGPNGTSEVVFTVEYTFGLSDYDYDHVQDFQYTATVQPASDDSSQSYEIVKYGHAVKTSDRHEDE
ncbi:zinc ribbon domain-containing protein [Levilactobacillus mulengensis]|uniref:zinc ribbon domain-containing protein n=1 Tax=Levilactobacillus mulengensis TaxID=2486025 RepID=UPI000F7B1D9F|nr:zinc ribbon domain-containing protein [Levilactobacillus mulengensis]